MISIIFLNIYVDIVGICRTPIDGGIIYTDVQIVQMFKKKFYNKQKFNSLCSIFEEYLKKHMVMNVNRHFMYVYGAVKLGSEMLSKTL